MVIFVLPRYDPGRRVRCQKPAVSADRWKRLRSPGVLTCECPCVLPVSCALASDGLDCRRRADSGHGYYGYPYGYGGWGAAGSWSATSQYNTTRNIQAADQLAGQAIAARQSAAMQNSIRNTMMTQAQTRTQDMLTSASPTRTGGSRSSSNSLPSARRRVHGCRPVGCPGHEF